MFAFKYSGPRAIYRENQTKTKNMKKKKKNAIEKRIFFTPQKKMVEPDKTVRWGERARAISSLIKSLVKILFRLQFFFSSSFSFLSPGPHFFFNSKKHRRREPTAVHIFKSITRHCPCSFWWHFLFKFLDNFTRMTLALYSTFIIIIMDIDSLTGKRVGGERRNKSEPDPDDNSPLQKNPNAFLFLFFAWLHFYAFKCTSTLYSQHPFFFRSLLFGQWEGVIFQLVRGGEIVRPLLSPCLFSLVPIRFSLSLDTEAAPGQIRRFFLSPSGITYKQKKKENHGRLKC